MAKYVITSVEDLVIAPDANTKNSRYPATSWDARSKFTTRAKARKWKSTRKHPSHWAIINVETRMVIR